jgi:hypothetical protein
MAAEGDGWRVDTGMAINANIAVIREYNWAMQKLSIVQQRLPADMVDGNLMANLASHTI